MSEILQKDYLKILSRQNTCFKYLKNTNCIDLFIANDTGSFQNTTTLSSRLSKFQKVILILLKITFQKLQTKEIICRNFKNIEFNKFKNEIRTKAQSADNYEKFEKEFLEVLNKHAPSKKKLV